MDFPTSTGTSIGRFKAVRSVWAGYPRRTLFFMFFYVKMSSPMDIQTYPPIVVQKQTSVGRFPLVHLRIQICSVNVLILEIDTN
jgi:hypothetical protein